MIDFYSHGSQIGFSLHGWGGLFLLLYFIVEVSFIFVTKTFIFHKLIISLRVRKQIKKIIPSWWNIDRISTITINKKSGGYEVYVKVSGKVGGWTNDCIIVDWLGRIKHNEIKKNIEYEDLKYQNEIKQWKRNNTLKDIGL